MKFLVRVSAVATIGILTSMQLVAQSYTESDLVADVEKACRLTSAIEESALKVGSIMTDTFVGRRTVVVRHGPQRLQLLSSSIGSELGLEDNSRELRNVNQRIFLNLAQANDHAEDLRLEFVELLSQSEYASERYGLLGVVELLGTNRSLQGTPSMSRLTALAPELRTEAVQKIREIPLEFLRLPIENQRAYSSLLEYAESAGGAASEVRPGGPHGAGGAERPGSAVGPGDPVRPGGPSSSIRPGTGVGTAPRRSGGPSSDDGFGWAELTEMGSNMMNDVLDNLYEDYQQGSEWGAEAGSIIGTVSGMQGAMNTVAQGATVVDVLDSAVDNMTPDPYEIVGQYAGGVIGMVGGALGTTAGWIYGTVEAAMASGSTRRSQTGEIVLF